MDQFAPMPLGGQQAGPGLWELLQQQQQQQHQHQHQHQHQQGPLSSGAAPTQPSFLHQGVLSGKPLSAVVGPGPLQVPTAPAGPDRPAQLGYHRPSAHATLGEVGPGAGLPPVQPAAAQQHATSLPLSGAALAAAAHLPPAGVALSHVAQQPGAAPLGPAGTFPAQHGQQAQQGVLPLGSSSSPGAVPTILSIPLMATTARGQPGAGGGSGGPLGDDHLLPASSPNSINRSPPGAAGSGGEPSGGSAGGSGGGGGGLAKSRYRGVSYDRKKGKWRVQIKVGGLRGGSR